MGEKQLMLGNAAIARGLWEAGVKVASAYPGTPSTEISENLVQYKDDLYCEWAPNEKVAAEVAFGASVAGVRSFACMKMVGFNVAADPVYSAAYAGVGRGMVLCVADDPGVYSSQNEQDTRAVSRAAQVPVLEPSDSQEAKDFAKIAYEISETYDKPVVIRTTTRLAHSQGMVELCPREEVPDKPYEKNIAKNVMLPANAIRRHVIVEDQMEKLAEDACSMEKLNRMEIRDTKIGFITSGIPYLYVREAMPEASTLKLGLVHPLPRKLIEEFASKVDRLIIFEELMPVIEEQVKSWGIACEGKSIFTKLGEYSANMIREKLLGVQIDAVPAENTPNRPPILCPGCPHRSTFWALKRLKLHVAGDIGCYTLGAVPPLATLETCLCMGASISSLHGMGKAKGEEYLRDWVSVIGDSTFMHTGVNSLMNMVYNQSTGTVIILDNRITAMTGHQDNPATGKTLMGQVVPAIDFEKFCQGLGIEHVYTVNALDQQELMETVKREVKADHLSVIVAKAPCALIPEARTKKKCVEIPEKCKHCGACSLPGCPALTKNEDGSITIDPTQCNGCGLCRQLCRFGAIKEVE
ncbi:MAG: indolepyruvate ferredoxin oxidoreductase subunit alpha [Lachnospiraceae bacterium]|nr:indolepyruvate ferredoxin oxidoreductase subunit alpha [Lachnospiraceae bacterium]